MGKEGGEDANKDTTNQYGEHEQGQRLQRWAHGVQRLEQERPSD
jgi:hypothetical protein